MSFNPYLEDYYGDIKRWAFCLETYFLKERFKDMLLLQKAGHTIVQDRSIFEGVYVFVRNNYERGDLDERDYLTYMMLFAQMKRQMNRRMNRQMRRQRRRTIGPENAGWPGGLAPAMPSAAEYSLLPEASNGGWQADWQGIWHGAGAPRLPAAVDACATSKAPCGRMPGRNSDGSPIQRVPRPLRHPGRLEPFCRDDRRRAPPPCGLDAALRSCQ